MPCDHAEIATRQAVLESGWFKSEAFVDKCNPFGLMWKGKIQEFESIEQACQEYHRQIYLQYKGGNYYEFLTRMGYAGDTAYIWKLKHIDLHGIHNTAAQQCHNGIHGRAAVPPRETLRELDGRRVQLNWLGRSAISRVLGLVGSRVVENPYVLNTSHGDKRNRGHRHRRHKEVAYHPFQRLHKLVQRQKH